MKRIFKAKKKIDIPPELMWESLKNFNLWLPDLKSIESIEYKKETDNNPFCIQGRKYLVYTPEKIVMESQILDVDNRLMQLKLQGKHSFLVSNLSCKIYPIDKNCCEIERIQEYKGIFSFLFTLFFNSREKKETNDYLTVWEMFTRNREKSYE